MPKRSPVVVVCAAAAGALLLSKQAFVPAPKTHRRAQISAVAGSVAALGAAPAFADEIGDAAKKLSEASYPYLKEINWNSIQFLAKPGPASAVDWAKAIDKAIVMGTAMDSKLLQDAVQAHIKAIKSIDANGVTSKTDYTAVNAAIGRLVASVPEDTTMAVYNAFDAIVPKDVAEYQMSQVKADDAKAAYAAFMDFKDVVRTHPIAPGVDVSTSKISEAKLSAIAEAANALSSASYPFMKDVDWTSDIYLKPFPGQSAPTVLKAVNKALVMGAAMDPKLLKEAGEAHHNAIAGIDANGLLSASDYYRVNAALGKLVASVPEAKTLEVFNAFKDAVGTYIPNNLYTLVGNPGDALAAYSAFWQFKDVVKAAQM